MRKTAAVIGIFLSIGLASCGSSASEAMIEMVDGVEYVHNTEIPQFPEKTVSFEEEIRISGEDKDGEILIFQPGYFTVSPEGDIYISDGQERKIHVFDEAGRYLRAFAGKGEGPGEFQRIGEMAVLPDGRLMVIDWLSRRTSFFEKTGSYMGGYPWRNPHYDIFWCDEDGCVMDDRIYAGEATTLTVKTFDYDGREQQNFGEFKPAGLHSLTQGEYSFAISLPYAPHSVLAGDRLNKRLYHCLNDAYIIEVYDRMGTLIRKIDRPYKPVPFTEEDRQDYYDGIDRNPNKIFTKMARDVTLPTIKTITEGMVVDDLGNLWVRTFETREEGEISLSAMDIFNPDGQYIMRVWSEITPAYFQAGRMYTFIRNDEGYRTLVRYKVIRPN